MNHAEATELGRALRVIGEHGEMLTATTTTEKIQEIRKDLARATRLLEDSAGPAPATDCPEHPYGAVDEGAPDRCLFCQSRRHKAGQMPRAPGPRVGQVPVGRRPQCPRCHRPLARGDVDAICSDCREEASA